MIRDREIQCRPQKQTLLKMAEDQKKKKKDEVSELPEQFTKLSTFFISRDL